MIAKVQILKDASYNRKVFCLIGIFLSCFIIRINAIQEVVRSTFVGEGEKAQVVFSEQVSVTAIRGTVTL